MSKRIFQLINLIFALLIIAVAGISLVLGSQSPVYPKGSIPDLPSLDSNLRFMGGMGLGLGLALLYIIPSIEKHTSYSGLFGSVHFWEVLAE